MTDLITNQLLLSLPEESLARLQPYLRVVSLNRGDYLMRLGEMARYAYFPAGAAVSHLILLEDGNKTEVALTGREGMVGLSALLSAEVATHWTQVTIGGPALSVQSDVLKQEFLRNSHLQQVLLRYTRTRLDHIAQRVVCANRHGVAGRLCSYLLMLADRTAAGMLVVTHEVIASNLGTRRSGITMAAYALQQEGTISYNRGQIRILRRSALESASCGCYQTLCASAAII